MYNQPFYIPGYYSTAMPNLARGAMISNSALGAAGIAGRGASLFGKLGNAFGAIKAFNWGGLINNTSKTLGIINQTIPLVRQVGPMVGNMRSMLRLASAFKDETDTSPTNNQRNHNNQNNRRQNQPSNNMNNKNNSNINHTTNASNNDNIKKESIIDYSTDDSPTFFIN